VIATMAAVTFGTRCQVLFKAKTSIKDRGRKKNASSEESVGNWRTQRWG